MNCKTEIAAILSTFVLYSSAVWAAVPQEGVPMKQGLHQWPAMKGKLILVTGTYQDTTAFRRSYNFYYKDGKDEAWNQVPLLNKAGRMQLEWDSASGGEVTLADGVVSARNDAVYFIVADKRADHGYAEKGDITVTWYKLAQAGDELPDGPAYYLKPEFTRSYPKSAATVESILTKEMSLQPRK
jgi:hypothetical protein